MISFETNVKRIRKLMSRTVCVEEHQAVTLIKKRGGQKFVCNVRVWV